MPKSQANVLEAALQWSGALRRYVQAHPEARAQLQQDAAQVLGRKDIAAWFEHGALARDALEKHLRQVRQRIFATLMLRDIAAEASLHEVVAAMSWFADLAIAAAYRCAVEEAQRAYGLPYDERLAAAQDMLIVAMGKLGGRELNVSSDIDLIMLYAHEGETDGAKSGAKSISNHEFYTRISRIMTAILATPQADGFVFRTDLRLRPDGNSGPLAWSLGAFEKYLIGQGREWERYAWVKARTIQCPLFSVEHFALHSQRLEALRQPFVYRKYFDFDALDALRQLREKIRHEWHKRAARRKSLEALQNIKLGEGGIRELEFVVQLNQLIRAGRQPSLQQRNLLAALQKQRRAGIFSATQAAELEAAYIFLRRVEHFLQYREDEQTQLLPRQNEAQAELAGVMGFVDRAAFMAELKRHRDCVSANFHDSFRIAGLSSSEAGADQTKPQSQAPAPAPINEARAQAMQEQIDGLLASHRVQSLGRASLKRLHQLLPKLKDCAAACPEPETTLQRLLNLVERIAQRSAYLALLAEYPNTLARVARILSASNWAAEFLQRFPVLLDSLIEWRSLMQAPDFGAIKEQLATELDACLLPDGKPDVEQQMNLMRDTQHQITFKLLAQDLENQLAVETLADHLSALADLLLEETINRVWPLVQPASRNQAAPSPPRFAIVAYGKLGGKEIGYASDLDLVFLYEDQNQQASELYARLGRRVASWLATLTSSGRLYEIDLRLRPDGDAGLLALPIEAFERYQSQLAWPWEHQAITRARFVAGDPAIGARFEALRRAVILQARDKQKLKQDILAMRAKISAGHPNKSALFDLKHDSGGMVDIEFITQYLVLAQAANHPQLLDNLGNIALLRIAGAAGLIPLDLGNKVADAYRELRRRQHALRLQAAEKARVPPEEFAHERALVQELWQHTLES